MFFQAQRNLQDRLQSMKNAENARNEKQKKEKEKKEKLTLAERALDFKKTQRNVVSVTPTPLSTG